MVIRNDIHEIQTMSNVNMQKSVSLKEYETFKRKGQIGHFKCMFYHPFVTSKKGKEVQWIQRL